MMFRRVVAFWVVALAGHGATAKLGLRDLKMYKTTKATKALPLPPVLPEPAELTNLCPICADGSDPGPLSTEQFGELKLNSNMNQFLTEGGDGFETCFSIDLSCAALAEVMSTFTEQLVENGECKGYQELAYQLGCGCQTRPEILCDVCGAFGGTPQLLNEDG